MSIPPPRRPTRFLRCDACGRAFECTVAEVIRHVQADWPACCGYAMRYFVEAEMPTPLGMKRPHRNGP